MPPRLGLQIFGQATPDLIEDEADKGLGPIDVRRWHDEVERRGHFARHQVGNTPVAAARHLGDDGIAVETEERHGGGEHA